MGKTNMTRNMDANAKRSEAQRDPHVNVHVCMCTCMCMCMCMCVCVHVFVYVCMYMCMCARVHVCVHVRARATHKQPTTAAREVTHPSARRTFLDTLPITARLHPTLATARVAPRRRHTQAVAPLYDTSAWGKKEGQTHVSNETQIK